MLDVSYGHVNANHHVLRHSRQRLACGRRCTARTHRLPRFLPRFFFFCAPSAYLCHGVVWHHGGGVERGVRRSNSSSGGSWHQRAGIIDNVIRPCPVCMQRVKGAEERPTSARAVPLLRVVVLQVIPPPPPATGDPIQRFDQVKNFNLEIFCSNQLQNSTSFLRISRPIE